MHFLDVAKDLSKAYPQAGLLVASAPQPAGSPPYLNVAVLSQLNGNAIAIAVVESATSLEAGPEARWHWLSLLGLPLDVFSPATRLDDARRLAAEARLQVREFIPYTPGATSPAPDRLGRLRKAARAAVTGAVEAAGALAPARPLVASAPHTRGIPGPRRSHVGG